MSKDLDLFEFLRCTIDCMYISDLRIEPYNSMAKLLLNKLNLNQYPSSQVENVFKYIYF